MPMIRVTSGRITFPAYSRCPEEGCVVVRQAAGYCVS